jgi:rhodanese-related sulfurtransferase
MTALDYFKAKSEAYISPRELMARIAHDPASVLVIDVRIGPRPTRIRGAIDLPEPEISARLDELPKDRLLVLYCWETWCSLATKAAIPLLEAGFTVQELFGGIAAWNALHLPTEATDGPKPIACEC